MKIYLTCYPYGSPMNNDVIGYALAEDGTGLASHLSSHVEFSKHDMGLTCNWKHEHYARCYPEGYELEWVDAPETHEGWLNALALNKSKREVKE